MPEPVEAILAAGWRPPAEPVGYVVGRYDIFTKNIHMEPGATRLIESQGRAQIRADSLNYFAGHHIEQPGEWHVLEVRRATDA